MNDDINLPFLAITASLVVVAKLIQLILQYTINNNYKPMFQQLKLFDYFNISYEE